MYTIPSKSLFVVISHVQQSKRASGAQQNVANTHQLLETV